MHSSTTTQTNFRYASLILYSCNEWYIQFPIDFSESTDKNKEYWCGTLLQSVYMCFRSLRVQGLLQVKIEYFYELLKVTSDCLTSIQLREISVVCVSIILCIVVTYLSYFIDVTVTATSYYVCLLVGPSR